MDHKRVWRILAIFMAFTGTALSPRETMYTIDPAQSSVELGVFREGLFKAFGHDHVIAANLFSGTVHFDSSRVEESSVTLTIESKSLTVLDPGVSEKDRREVQSTMEGDKVLHVEAFPKIAFTSTGVSRVTRVGEEWEVSLAGKLSLHGVEKTITFPVRIGLESGRLRAKGEAFVTQSEFGMRPIRVAGGTVRVKDRVKVSFNIVAVKTG